MCSTGNLIPRKHPARCRTGTRVPALSLPWSCAALSIAAACEVPQRSSVPCSSPSRSSVQRWNPPAPCGAPPPPPHIAQHHRLHCSNQCRATQTPPARNGTHPSCLVQHLPMQAAPLQRCAAPGSPAAFPPPRICTQILPHHGIACCLHLLPSSRGKTPKGRFWGSRPAHPFQHSLPAEDILHTVVLFGASIRPCPLRIRSKIACTSLWAIPRRCLPRFGPLPCGLALGTCTAEI